MIITLVSTFWLNKTKIARVIKADNTFKSFVKKTRFYMVECQAKTITITNAGGLPHDDCRAIMGQTECTCK